MGYVASTESTLGQIMVLRLLQLLVTTTCVGCVFSQYLQNTDGSATLQREQGADECVYQLMSSDPFATCSQDSAHAQFSLAKRAGDPEYCVYFIPSGGSVPDPYYTVTFTCDINATESESSEVKVDIIPNAPPVFSEGPSVFKVADAETVKTNDPIFTSVATDSNSIDTVVYSLDMVYPEFDINTGTGEVFAKVDFNQLIVDTFTFTIVASDDHGTDTQQSVTLYLNNLNTAPDITNLPPGSLTYPENVAPGTVLYTCVHDEPTTPTMTLTVAPPTETANFDIDPATCELAVAAGGDLDFERTPSMTLTLTLDDGVYSSPFPLNLDLVDVNEPPIFSPVTYIANIDETTGSAPVPAPTYGITDPDAADVSGPFTYSLGTGTHDPFFSIDPTTGALTTVSELDFDTGVTSVSINVIATDSRGASATATVNIDVNDVNDNDPQFADSPVVYISPKTPTGPIYQAVATDVDSGVNGQLTYAIVSETSGGKLGMFADGRLILQTPVTVADSNDIYQVVVRATDDGTPPRSADITVIVLFDPPPVITNIPNVAFISEDTTTRLDIFQIEATDVNDFSCSADSVTPGTPNVAFEVDQKPPGTDWHVFYSGLQTLSSATNPQFLVNVKCTDINDGESVVSTLTVNVRPNQAPTLDCTNTLFGVDASATKIGDTVHTVVANDDNVLTYTWNLLTSPGTFTMDAVGVITSQKDLIQETPSQYIGVVSVTDTFNTVSCTITLTMTNTNQAPEFVPTATVFVDEDLAPGDVLYTLTISDAQECSTTTFTMNVDPVLDTAKFIAVMMPGNEVQISLAANQELDFETTSSYEFYLQANDGCLDSQVHRLFVTIVDVNDPVVFRTGNVYTATFKEVNNGAVNLGCDGLDEDVWDTQTLTLTGAGSNLFTLSNPAQCTLLPVAELDRDNGGPGTYTLTMTTRDLADTSAIATIIVTVDEENDNAPTCDNPAVFIGPIFNSDTPGRGLGSISATDIDTNDAVTYSIVPPSTTSGVVSLTSNGQFLLSGDPETVLAPGTLLDFTVRATDTGSPALYTECKANIQYIYTTTPAPTTAPPVVVTTGAAGGGGTTGTGTGAGTGTGSGSGSLSTVEGALQNPVVLGLVAALGALFLIGTIVGIALCCKKCGKCNGSKSGSHDISKNRYERGASKASQRRWSEGRKGSPKSNQVSSSPNTKIESTELATVNEFGPNDDWVLPRPKGRVNNTPTTFKYL